MRRCERFIFALLLMLLIMSGCASEDPDSALRSLIDSAEAAAESRDTGFFRDLIAESFVDDRGIGRDELIDRIRAYFLINQNIDVVTRITEIELHGEDAADLVVLAGVLGRRPGDGPLGSFDGEVYRLNLELVASDGDWRVIGARWSRSLEALVGE
jgi:hypothetical protein